MTKIEVDFDADGKLAEQLNAVLNKALRQEFLQQANYHIQQATARHLNNPKTQFHKRLAAHLDTLMPKLVEEVLPTAETIRQMMVDKTMATMEHRMRKVRKQIADSVL